MTFAAVGARYSEARKAATLEPDPIRHLDRSATPLTLVMRAR